MWIGWKSKAGALVVRSPVVEAIGTWNVTSLVRKEPVFVREVERYKLDIVSRTSMHSLGS